MQRVLTHLLQIDEKLRCRYGSDEETSNKLRSFFQGKLLSSKINGKEIVPLDPASNVTHPEACNTSSCYMAGNYEAIIIVIS